MPTRSRAHALALSVASMAAVLSLTLATPNASAAPTDPDPTTPTTTSAQPTTPPADTTPSTPATTQPPTDTPATSEPSTGEETAPSSDPSATAPSASTPSTEAPKSSSTAPARPQARAAVAAGCQTYPPTSYQVCGRIRDKYNQLNGPNGYLLFPKSNELTNPGNTGKRSEFVGGNIYWSTATDAHPVAHDFLTKWGQYGYEGGFLKYPTTDEIPLGIGVDGRRQEFQGGYLYFDFPSGTHNVQGAILDKYKAIGGPGSYLGFPTSDETVTPDGKGRYNYFQNGAIYWSTQTGAYAISGQILRQWSSAGFEKSTFGYPTADQTTTQGKARDQQFQGGRIYAPGTLIGGNFSLGLGTTGTYTVTEQGAGVSYQGNGMNFGFGLVNSRDQIQRTTINLSASTSTRRVTVLAGLPSGFRLAKSGERVNIVDGQGAVQGEVRKPVGVLSNRARVDITTIVDNNRITYEFAPTGTQSGVVRFLASEPPTYTDIPHWEEGTTCVVNPYDCARAFDDQEQAEKESDQNFPYQKLNDRNDANRHCLWQAYTTESANEGFAREIAAAHEEASPGPANAGLMDLYNNVTGRAIGLRNEGNRTGIRSECNSFTTNAREITSTRDLELAESNGSDLIVLGGEANGE